MAKKPKEIKTYKSHSTPSIFMGLFSILFALTFVVFFFIPAFTLTKGEEIITFSGLDYVLFGVSKYVKPILPPEMFANTDTFLAYFNDYAGKNGIIKTVLGFHETIELILSGLIIVALVLAAIALILAFVWFFKGRIAFPKSTLILAHWSNSLFDTSAGLLYLYVWFFSLIVAEQAEPTSAMALAYPGVVLGVQTAIIILIRITYKVGYKGRVYDDPNKFEKLHANDNKNNPTGEVAERGLPANITSCGDRAFMNDQYLTQAKIPDGISILGNNAFANCRNLKVVYIPDSVVKIGNNCFFNCRNLQVIAYGGRQDDWSRIKRGSNWLAGAATTNINTRDGLIAVNPNH